VGRDVGKRKRTALGRGGRSGAAARSDREQLGLAEIVRASALPIGMADLDGRALFLNRAGQRLMGLHGPEEVLRTTVLDCFRPEDRGFVRDEVLPVVLRAGRWSGDTFGDREILLRNVQTGETSSVFLECVRLDDPRTGEPFGIGIVVFGLDAFDRLDREPQGGRVRVLLVEDHASVREAIATAFEREASFEVIGQAASLREAREMLVDIDIDIAVIDLGLPDGDGGELIGELREANPRAQALVLSATLDRADTARAIDSGAAGALNKTAHLDEVVDAVRRLRSGETLLPLDEVLDLLRFAKRQRQQEHVDREAIERLTAREREVLQALADGLDSQAIADRLHITIRTQRNHVANILAKLSVHSQLQALVFGLRYDLVSVRPPARD
jgi:DNA-binding NarL/FixJ family response regulator